MMRFDIITIFPEVVEPYLGTSILKRAQDKKLAKMTAYDLRKWTKDKHRSVDDSPYGGGPGMVMMVDPIYRAVKALKAKRSSLNARKTRVLLTSAAGRPFDQRRAKYYASRYDRLIIICGRYEGVDHRIARYVADEEVSVGPYVLTGGELPALTVVDAVTRLIPGVISPQSLIEETHNLQPTTNKNGTGSVPNAKRGLTPRGTHRSDGDLPPVPIGEYPQYTRPEVFYPERSRGDTPKKGVSWRVPKVLLTGNHAKIKKWRLEHRR